MLIDDYELTRQIERMKDVNRDDVIALIGRQKPIDAVPVVRCKDCKWFDRKEGSCLGYCHAIKHAYYSERWEIGIYRQYKEDFYCADGERKEG